MYMYMYLHVNATICIIINYTLFYNMAACATAVCKKTELYFEENNIKQSKLFLAWLFKVGHHFIHWVIVLAFWCHCYQIWENSKVVTGKKVVLQIAKYFQNFSSAAHCRRAV